MSLSDSSRISEESLHKLLQVFKILLLSNGENDDDHCGVTCDFCKKQDFTDYRYKCIYCKNYDLCGDCYEKKKVNKDHVIDHPVLLLDKPVQEDFKQVLDLMNMGGLDKLAVQFSDVVHSTTKCQGCNINPIRGIRVKCEECLNYDQCWKCFQQNNPKGKHLKSHQEIVFLTPQLNQFDVQKDIDVIEADIAKGCFGSVSKVKIKKTSEIAALKSINIQAANQLLKTSFENEIKAYNEIRSLRVIRYFGYQINEQKQKLYILMEFMNGGSLQNVLEKNEANYSYRRRFQWLLQISKGLRRMHSKGFIHKDIKPDNILLTEKQDVKIGDMGVSAYKSGNYCYDFIAPMNYSAPEVILQQKFTEKADIFQLGLLANQLFTFKKHSQEREGDKIVFEYKQKAPGIWFMIEKWLDYNPKNRPSSNDVEIELEKVDKYFWNNLPISKKEYIKSNNEIKDKIFLSIMEKAQNSKILTIKMDYNVIEKDMDEDRTDSIVQMIYSVLLEQGKKLMLSTCKRIKECLENKYGEYFLVFQMNKSDEFDSSYSYRRGWQLFVEIEELKFLIFKQPQQ